MITCEKKKGKYVLNKNGIYFSLSEYQLTEMIELCKALRNNSRGEQVND